MSLHSLIRRHAGQLLRTPIQIEVRSGGVYDRGSGKVTGQAITVFDVVASDAGALQKSFRPDATTPQATGFFYVPVPLAGLGFDPQLAQTVIAYERRWRVIEVRPRRAHGTLIGYQFDVAGGGG